MSKKPRLGRGLEALLGSDAVSAPDAAAPTGAAVEHGWREVPINQLCQGRYQPRVDMRQDTLHELAESIRAQGVVQPIVVRPSADATETFEIIAGERRWRAAQIAGLDKVPVVLREVPDQAVVAMALIENIQREDLNPLEEANALRRLTQEFGLTHQQAGNSVGRSRVAVSNLLRLLELNDQVKDWVAARQLDMGHARAILSLPQGRQTAAARQIMDRQLSVREAERLAKTLLNPALSDTAAHNAESLDPDVRRLQTELSERLGARTEIKAGRNGKGRIVIQYHSLDELDGIVRRMR